MEVIHDKDNHQFKMEIDGEIAKVDYELKEGKMYLVHSEVPFRMRGKGFGKLLVEHTFEKLVEEGYQAIAICGYIKSVARNSEKWNTIIG